MYIPGVSKDLPNGLRLALDRSCTIEGSFDKLRMTTIFRNQTSIPVP